MPVAELRPLPAGRRRLVPRTAPVEAATRLPHVNREALRSDLHAVADPWLDL